MQDNAGQQYLPGCWCGVAGGFVQGHHMAYSSALEVKSFAFCYCSQIVHAVILFVTSLDSLVVLCHGLVFDEQ